MVTKGASEEGVEFSLGREKVMDNLPEKELMPTI